MRTNACIYFYNISQINILIMVLILRRVYKNTYLKLYLKNVITLFAIYLYRYEYIFKIFNIFFLKVWLEDVLNIL